MSAKTPAADALRAARSDLEAIRDRISDLKSELQDVSRAPADRAEAERRVEAIIAQAQAQARALFKEPMLFAPDGGKLNPYFTRALQGDPLGVLATLFPDQLAAAFLEHHPGGGLSPDARAARMADLERDLLACEVAEEIACREIESATGGTLPRRVDARPEVVLAPTPELEGEAA